MKVLVVGYGSMGHRHARNARLLGNDVAVVDVDGAREKQARQDGYRATHKSPQAVIIAAPAKTHSGLLALYGHIDRVMIEKPLDVRAPAGTAAGSSVRVGYNLRYHPGVCALRRMLPAVGPPYGALFNIQCDKSSWPGRNYEDMLLEGSHEIDLALWLLGPAVVIGAAGRDDVWTLMLHHERGAVSVINLDGMHTGYRRYCEISGPRGLLHWQWRREDWQWTLSGPGGQTQGTTTPEETYLSEMADFLGPQQYLCSFDEGLSALRICDAARLMAVNQLSKGATR